MLDWIRDIPDPIWIPVITGLFLVGQSVLNNRREDKRRAEERDEREKDREHQLELARHEREAALSDAWRDDRRQAHADLLAGLEALHDDIAWAGVIAYDLDGRVIVLSRYAETVSDQQRADLGRALARVDLLASDAAREAGSDA